MPTMQRLPDDHPEMKAFELYKNTPEYRNTLKWASQNNYTEGSLWAAFDEGWQAAMRTPVNTAEAPPIQHILTRDQRDALCAANAYLTIMQSDYEQMFARLQNVINEISDILYG
jgi:hypothetical protein